MRRKSTKGFVDWAIAKTEVLIASHSAEARVSGEPRGRAIEERAMALERQVDDLTAVGKLGHG